MNYMIQAQMPVGEQLTMHYLSKTDKLVRICTPHHPSEQPKLFKLREKAQPSVRKLKEQFQFQPKVQIRVVPEDGVFLKDH